MINLRASAVAFLASASFVIAAQTSQPAAPRLLQIAASETSSRVTVTLQGSGAITVRPIRETPGTPPFLVVDLAGVRPGTITSIPMNRGPLSRVHVFLLSAAPPATRVVLELNKRVAYHTTPLQKTQAGLQEFTVVLGEPLVLDKPSTVSKAATASQTPLAASAESTGTPTGTPPTGTKPNTAPAIVSSSAPATASSEPANAASRVSASTTDTAAATVSADATAQLPGSIPISRSTLPSAPRSWGRASFYVDAARTQAVEGPATEYTELISSFAYRTPEGEGDGAEYGLDLRHSANTLEGRTPRLSIYDGFIGARLKGGMLRMRAGHMWLNDLGALGSVAGGLFEARTVPTTPSESSVFRAGVFGGLEPNVYRMGYAGNVRKVGGYVAVDAPHNRRHVLGYVNVKNTALTERSVITVANFVPAGTQFFLYQAAEYDLKGPAGILRGGLTYFFSNARYSPTSRIELQQTYNRGRSLDVRGITQDILNGRPVSAQAVEGLLYQSIGGRVTVEVVPRIRIYAGYARDKNNREDITTGRLLVGGYASNIGRTGLDVAASDSRIERSAGNYHSTYVSIGRQLGERVYLSGDYTTSLSLVQFSRSDGIIVETKPHTTQFGATAVINVGRAMSLLVTGEQTRDASVSEFRSLAGITFRF